jgi:hypothetical protein
MEKNNSNMLKLKNEITDLINEAKRLENSFIAGGENAKFFEAKQKGLYEAIRAINVFL